jgi:hypothetical protein
LEKRLLILLAAGHIAAGLLLCALYFVTPLHAPILQMVYTARPGATENSTQLIFWLCILGPTIASWGVLFLALVQQFFITQSRMIWNSLLAAVLVWAPLDSTLCLLNGIYAGTIGNIAVTIIFLVLLFRIRVLIK